MFSGGGNKEASLTQQLPIGGTRGGVGGGTFATFSLPCHLVDRWLLILVLNSTMLLALRYLAWSSRLLALPTLQNVPATEYL
jgi:hypothetical protein